MNSIYFSEEHRALRDQVTRFVDNEVRPHGHKWEEQGFVPRDLLRKMGELGFLGIRYPSCYGGAELGPLSTVVLAEELSKSSFGGLSATVFVHTDMASPHLAHFGSPAQLDRYMPAIVAGEKITAVAVTEPDAGSDVAALRTTARRSDDGWVLNGSKMFITNGVHADIYFVAARTDPNAKGSRGLSMFIVEKGTPGFHVARPLDKFGWRSSDTAELVFSDCHIPADALLGKENHGFYSVMRNFQNERLVIGAMAVGESTRALEITRRYAKERKAFGGVLWDRQVIRHRLATLDARVQALRQLVYHAAWLMEREIECVKEVSMVKALGGDLVNEVMYACQQFHGGFGYMRESEIERLVRDARILAIGGGATEVMLEEVAKRYE
jgi:acyl-CoA dehydrogenase